MDRCGVVESSEERFSYPGVRTVNQDASINVRFLLSTALLFVFW